MAAPSLPFKVVVAVMTAAVVVGFQAVAATWCIIRSEASEQALQTALDYACGAGADCGPIKSSGLCFLPNTIQAHASYAFNSYYQRMATAPGSCDFSGTATVAKTDPSYGSCVYPSSSREEGKKERRRMKKTNKFIISAAVLHQSNKTNKQINK